MGFVETPIFTAVMQRHLHTEYHNSIALMLRPAQGPVIPGSGGLRKVRWAAAGGGKRGGLRVLYYWVAGEQTIYMVYAYSKSAQGDLTRAQIRQLGRRVREDLE